MTTCTLRGFQVTTVHLQLWIYLEAVMDVRPLNIMKMENGSICENTRRE